MAIRLVKMPTKKQDLFLRVAKGHFATSHSHINYFIDVTIQKTRLSEARAAGAGFLLYPYHHCRYHPLSGWHRGNWVLHGQ